MIAPNPDFAFSHALSQGVWLAFDQKADLKWAGVMGYVAYPDDADLIKQHLEAKGYFVDVKDMAMEKKTGMPVPPAHAMRPEMEKKVIKVWDIQVRAKGEDWNAEAPYKNTVPFQAEDIISRFFRKNPHVGKTEIEEFDAAVVAMLDRVKPKRGFELG